MSAFIVVTTKIKDQAKFQDYAQQSMPTFQPFGGELVTRGMIDRPILGEADHHSVAVIRFPDIEKLNAWYGSEAYSGLAGLRNAAADMAMTAYQVPA